MRIIAGKAGGLPLKSIKNSKVRPTQDSVKESLFNILTPYIRGSRILDLYAGFGSLGLEALSRGASRAVFVERTRANSKIIEENLERCQFLESGKVIRSDVFKYLKKDKGSPLPPQEKFDIIFMDPPYNKGLVQSTLSRLVEVNLLKPDGIIICELHKKEKLQLPYDLQELRTENYGDTAIRIFKMEGD